MTGAPAEILPQGWSAACIGDVVAHDGLFVDGDWVESKDQDPSGGVRLIQLADIGDGHFIDKSARFLTKKKAYDLKCTFLQKDDLLIARMPDPLGRSCTFPFEGTEKYVTVVDVCTVRFGSSQANGKYMMYLINGPKVRTEIEALKSGSTRKRISRKNLATIRMPVAPVNEQHRIVAKIEELFSEMDKGIESLKTAREQLKVYRQAVLKHAFEGKLTEKWREDNKDKLEEPGELLERIEKVRQERNEQQTEEWKAAVIAWEEDGKRGPRPRKPPNYKATKPISAKELSLLPPIASDWEFVRLTEVAQIGSGMSVSKSRKLADPLETAYLRVANVQRGFLVLDEIKSMPIERTQLPGLALKKWDVLFNEGGDRDKLGRGWIWRSEIEPCITQNHVFRASLYLASEHAAKMLSHWGNTFGQKYFEETGKQTTNLASINKTVLSEFPVPLISPAEQHEICIRIDQSMTLINNQEREVECALRRSELMRQSILRRAFSGELVTQDPKDEPASELLARIKAEKEEREQVKKAGKKKAKRKTKRKDAA